MAAKTSTSLTDEQGAYDRALVPQGRPASVQRRNADLLLRDDETHRAGDQALQGLIDRGRTESSIPLEPNSEALLAAIDRAE